MIIRCRRVSPNTEYGTFGTLLNDFIPFACTIERPWLNNQKFISCIPDGQYETRLVVSPKYGRTFEIIVPGRDHVLFHWGNIDDQSEACVIVGENFCPVTVNGVPNYGVGNSRTTPGQGFLEFLDLTKGVSGFTYIVESWGTKLC